MQSWMTFRQRLHITHPHNPQIIETFIHYKESIFHLNLILIYIDLDLDTSINF